MIRYLSVATCLALIACGGGDDTDTGGTDTDTTTSGTCGNPIDSAATNPPDGATDAYFRTTVEFTLTTAETGATISVSGPSGDVAGDVSTDGTRVIFTPAAPLDAGASYTSTLTWSCGTTSATFTTSEVGSAVDAASLNGNTYALDLTTGRFIQPPGVGELIGSLLTVDVLIGITSADSASLGMIGAISNGDDPPTQDTCSPTIDFPIDADFTQNPYFEISAPSLDLDVAGVPVGVTDLLISGAFGPNGDYISGAVLEGQIDVTPLAGALDLTGSGDACTLLGALGISCVTCADGTGDHCLDIAVDSMSADKVGLTIEVITEADVAGDPSCATTGS